MNFVEFYDKYKTDKKEIQEVKIVGLIGQDKAKVMTTVHEAFLGDLIKDYIIHLNTPWYKKDWSWTDVEKRLRELLNSWGIVQWHV